MAQKPKISKNLLSEKGIFVDTLSKNKDGNYVARREFFYTHGKTSQMFADEIAKFPDVVIIDHGEKLRPFRGGASTANSSHWYVIFKLK